MLLHGYHAMVVVAGLGVTETPGRSAVKPRNETPDGSLSEGADLRQGNNGHFHSVNTL